MSVSPWYHVSHTFMTVWPFSFTSGSSSQGLWHGFVFRPHLFYPLTVILCISKILKIGDGYVIAARHMSVSPWYNVSRTLMSSVWPWPLTSKQNYILTMDISLARCLCSLTQAYQILAYGCMLCTFLTFVWPWPLTYMWVAGGSLMSITHSFYLFL